MNTLDLSNTAENISEQREALLKMNPDLVFGVYNLDKKNYAVWYELSLATSYLTCYPNQIDSLKGLDENNDITLVDLWALRKWRIKVINGVQQEQLSNPVLLSNGVIDYVEATNKEWITKQHIITTLRDWWAADWAMRTTTAWRNTWNHLDEAIEEELMGEAPFF